MECIYHTMHSFTHSRSAYIIQCIHPFIHGGHTSYNAFIPSHIHSSSVCSTKKGVKSIHAPIHSLIHTSMHACMHIRIHPSINLPTHPPTHLSNIQQISLKCRNYSYLCLFQPCSYFLSWNKERKGDLRLKKSRELMSL